jgi:hypothetical protein
MRLPDILREIARSHARSQRCLTTEGLLALALGLAGAFAGSRLLTTM